MAEEQSFKYGLVEIPDEPTVISDYILAVYDNPIYNWYEARGDHSMPTRSAYGFGQLGGWHDRVAVQEIPDSCDDFKTLILGEEFRSIFGFEHARGDFVSDLPGLDKEGFQSFVKNYHGGRKLGYSSGRIVISSREYLSLTILDLPVSDQHGHHRYSYGFIRQTLVKNQL